MLLFTRKNSLPLLALLGAFFSCGNAIANENENQYWTTTKYAGLLTTMSPFLTTRDETRESKASTERSEHRRKVKIVERAREDAVIFVASDYQEETARLNAALEILREDVYVCRKYVKNAHYLATCSRMTNAELVHHIISYF